MTHQELTRERNLFLGIFILGPPLVLFLISIFLAAAETTIIPTGYLYFLSITPCIYAVYKLSKFFKVDTSLIILYSLLAMFPVLYLVPFIGLLLRVKFVRRTINVPSELIKLD